MRTKKALYNVASQMIYEVITMICGLILPRLILSKFGSNYNGIISSITQFLDYISILTIGIAGATRVAIYKANASDDIDKVSSIIKANQKYMRKIAFIFIIYMILLAIFFPFIVNSDISWINISSLVIIIGLGTFAEYFFGITYSTFLSANQSRYIYNIIRMFFKVLSTVISVILIYMNFSIQIVKLGSAVCFVLCPLILEIIVTRKFKINKNATPDDEALSQRKDVMGHSIANCIHQYTDIFLLTIFTSPVVISVYSVYNLIFSSLKKLQDVFTTGLESAFGDLWARKKFESFEKNFNIFEFMIYIFVSVLFSCTLLLIVPFVKIYTKNISDTNYILPLFANVSTITYAFFCLRTPYLIAVQAAGKYKETRNGAYVEAGMNFIISFLLVKKFGLIGVTIGTLVANLFRTFQYVIYISKNMINRSILVFIRKIIWLTLNIFISNIICSKVLLFSINNWCEWAIVGLLYFIIASSVTLFTSFIFYNKDLNNSMNVLKKFILFKFKT